MFLPCSREDSYPIWVTVPTQFEWRFLPRLSEGTPQFWWQPPGLRWLLSQRKTSVARSCPGALPLSSVQWPCTPCCHCRIPVTHKESPHHNPQGKRNWNSSHARCARGKHIRVNMRNYWHLSLPSVGQLWHVFIIILKSLAQSHLPYV